MSNYYECCTKFERKNIFFKWTIEDFSILKMHDLHFNLESQEFSDFRFVFKTMTYGSNELWVRLTQNNKEFKALKGTVRIRTQNDVQFKTCLSDFSQPIDIHLGKLETSLINANDQLFNDKLIMHCEIELVLKQIDKPRYTTKISTKSFREDFRVLFYTKEFSDVTIVTADDHKIPVHKLILSARSKVFAAIFRHPLKESKENCVTISDYNSDVVNEMLRFIYTGEAFNLKDIDADLIAAAEKYQLDKLKAMCAQSMSDNLSIETAPIVLKSAVIYNVEDLKLEAIRYIENNLEKVTETSNWKELVTSDKNLISEAFINPTLIDLKLKEDTSIKE